MNRADKLRARAPGADDGLVAQLAALPAEVVDAVAKFGTHARRDGVAHDRELRRRRRADARAHGHYDAEELTARTRRAVAADGRRAGYNLEALAGLAMIKRTADDLILAAVPQLRTQGYSDTEIAAALGISQPAVCQRWGKRTPLAP